MREKTANIRNRVNMWVSVGVRNGTWAEVRVRIWRHALSVRSMSTASWSVSTSQTPSQQSVTKGHSLNLIFSCTTWATGLMYLASMKSPRERQGQSTSHTRPPAQVCVCRKCAECPGSTNSPKSEIFTAQIPQQHIDATKHRTRTCTKHPLTQRHRRESRRRRTGTEGDPAAQIADARVLVGVERLDESRGKWGLEGGEMVGSVTKCPDDTQKGNGQTALRNGNRRRLIGEKEGEQRDGRASVRERRHASKT
eukprot:3577088-Pleurochrysis_carterae.AAC.1